MIQSAYAVQEEVAHPQHFVAEVPLRVENPYGNSVVVGFKPYLTRGQEPSWRTCDVSFEFVVGDQRMKFISFPRMRRWTLEQTLEWSKLTQDLGLDMDKIFEEAALDLLI